MEAKKIMKTKSQTTYIILDRGSEDIALYYELNKIMAELRVESYKDFIKKYPLLYELKHNLKEEINNDNINI